MQQHSSVGFNLLLVPVVLFLALTAVAFGLMALRMVFSTRYRVVGIGMLGAMCFGAMFVVGIFVTYAARQQSRASAVRFEAQRVYQDELEHIVRANSVQFRPLPPRPPVEVPTISVDVETEVAQPAEIAAEDGQFIGTEPESIEAAPQETNPDSRVDDVIEAKSDEAMLDEVQVSDVTITANETSDPIEQIVQDATITEFNPMSNQAPRPDWLDDPPDQIDGYDAKVVSSDPSTDLSACTESLVNKTELACKGHVRSYSPWRIRTPPQLLTAAVRDEYVESRLTSLGQRQIAHRLLVFDDDFKRLASTEIKNARITNRLTGTGVVSGVVLAALTGVFGVFSFAHGRHERRLSSQQRANV